MNPNQQLLKKLCVIAVGMFGFGFALVPLYNAICEATGVNVLAQSEQFQWWGRPRSTALANTQVDLSRQVTIEFDANTQGLWAFKPAQRSLTVHPGELNTIMYEFENTQNRPLSAQAIPSYAPQASAPYFKKLECFCFRQYHLAPGEKKQWPVVFVVDPQLPQAIVNLTLSYTFFEIGGQGQTALSAPVVSTDTHPLDLPERLDLTERFGSV